jgi:hypothetical protein
MYTWIPTKSEWMCFNQASSQHSRPSGRAVLRRGSAAVRLVGLWVRNPPWEWISVVCVVWFPVEVSATGWSLVQRSPTDCGVSIECDRKAPQVEAMTWNRVETSSGENNHPNTRHVIINFVCLKVPGKDRKSFQVNLCMFVCQYRSL